MKSLSFSLAFTNSLEYLSSSLISRPIVLDVVYLVGLFDAFHAKSDKEYSEGSEGQGERERSGIEKEFHDPIVKFERAFFS